MVRRLFAIALVLFLVGGCGQSTPPSPQQLVQQGDYEQAIELCTQRSRANPRDAEAYPYRGRAYHCRNGEGDLDRAIADFSESIAQDPKNSEAYYSRSLAYRDRGDVDKSTTDDQEARKLDSRLQAIYAQLPEPSVAAPATPEPAAEEADKQAEAKPETSSPSLLKPPTDELQEYERLKKRFEPNASGQAAAEPPDPTLELLKKPTFKMPSSTTSEEPPAAGGLGSARPGRTEDLEPAPTTGRPSSPRSTAGAPGRTGDVLPPTSPWRTREPSGGLGITPPSRNYTSPFQAPTVPPLARSPFPQRSPRPTGYVEEPLPPQATQPRQIYTNTQSVPTVRPFGAYHYDYNP